jgi:hypothetical protein
MVMWELLSGKQPWEGMSDAAVLAAVSNALLTQCTR